MPEKCDVYTLNPLADERWNAFVEPHPDTSIFHTVGWLDALSRTYGYDPVVYTTTPPTRELQDGIVLCRVRSWITGSRLVSLPFSDHCEPLASGDSDLRQLLSAIRSERLTGGWKYIEIRPIGSIAASDEDNEAFKKSEEFYLFTLPLDRDIEQIHANIKSDIRMRIRQVARENYKLDKGNSEKLIRAFYDLHTITRAEKGLPPQPVSWFRNLAECLGERISVYLLSDDTRPIAGLVTVLFNGTLTWKYTASNRRYDKAGAEKLLMWQSIRDAKLQGATKLDLGRCRAENVGLVEFKRRWGATQQTLVYYRDQQQAGKSTRARWKPEMSQRKNRVVPRGLLVVLGSLLYRHVG